MKRWWQEHAVVNGVHLHCLMQIQGLPGFSGVLKLGICECMSMDTTEELAVPPDTTEDQAVPPASGINGHAHEVKRIISSEYHTDTDIQEQMEDDQSLELFAQYIECIGD